MGICGEAAAEFNWQVPGWLHVSFRLSGKQHEVQPRLVSCAVPLQHLETCSSPGVPEIGAS